jgi:hypothetical protein
LIRLQSLQFKADKDTHMMMQLGWWDPEMKIPRARMMVMCMETLKAFQTHIRLGGGGFDVEKMAKFCMNRKELGPELRKVVIFDGNGGNGAEIDRNEPDNQYGVNFDIDEFKERLKTYMDDQLIQVQELATKNDHQDIVDAVNAEFERRKV